MNEPDQVYPPDTGILLPSHTDLSRYDHATIIRHRFGEELGLPGTPKPGGTASAGTGEAPARWDHVHPGGGGAGTPRLTFNRVGVTAVAASDYAWVGYPETAPMNGHRFLGWSALWRVAPTATNIVKLYQNDIEKFSFTFNAGDTRKIFIPLDTDPHVDGYSWGAPSIALASCAVWSCIITTAGSTAAGLVVEAWFGPIAIP